ncbi:outer membrane lipoprotein chaperone LolA [Thalassotalea mangrovi]|uniref:Outer-membrane lipoprotein carrier protein n=1 Tax=Thalassotalea mangrovi TaxID=2572245 RepID=A0A4U1B2L4_9GAMM|nr:outer membrane lipoprotein chaperone LolA [Thalassotalea mangrovi]TKB43740.1 outer membrane lipoprotein chaperone LolA [Thalassotalea mangrovi]
MLKLKKLSKLSSLLFIGSLASSFVAQANDAKQQLISKLEVVGGFSANFTQLVTDADGNELQQQSGVLKVRRPNLIYWKTVEPDETLVVSDGKTLWFYNPFVEQVSAFKVDTAVANTPILLLSGSDQSLWQDYQVSMKDKSSYTISSLDENAQVKTLDLSFQGDTLVAFTIEDATGQFSEFHLSDVNSDPLPTLQQFTFTLPEGVDFDDQR